jgi:hypothetical protein
LPDNLAVGSTQAVIYEFMLHLPKTYYPPETRNIFDLPARITII